MPGNFGDSLSPEEIDALVSYLTAGEVKRSKGVIG